MDPKTNPLHIDRDAAIDMAVYSGNLLYKQSDDGHFWALTLIISNLFELIGEGDNGSDRFVNGFIEVVNFGHDTETVHGWHAGCIARAIRNLIVHGMEADIEQKKNYNSNETVKVVSLGVIASIDKNDSIVYDVDRITDTRYRLRFSPHVFWSYVEEWYRNRTVK